MIATIVMDSAGRLVVPKRFRDQLGLEAGSAEFEIRDTPDGLILTLKGEAVPVTRRPSGWVVFDSGTEEVDAVDEVTRERERRIRHLRGDD